ncbi:MAG: MCP four helix bundle domain-containing protein [Crocinitomicaceae bacterium]
MNLRKIKWIFGILFVFLLILATNLIDQGNFNKIQKSIKNIYEDRLTAHDIVYKMTSLMNEKDMANAMSDTIFYRNRNSQLNAELKQLMADYQETNLSPEEVASFAELKQHVMALKSAESKSVEAGEYEPQNIENSIKAIKVDLGLLADLQIAEGWRELKSGKKAARSIEMFTQIEIYVLIVLAIIFQVIILYKPRQVKDE